ncbi:peptidylprolyl isomerase [bacterium]|nr:peptidylprolyl isomerase [bacterium]
MTVADNNTPNPQIVTSPEAKNFDLLVPFNATTAPNITKIIKVRFTTTEGDLEINVYPEAAPNASKRFIDLINIGFYNYTPIFRVVRTPRPFVAQFGINWREGMNELRTRNFNDDPSLFRLNRGTLAFAKAGPNINSTQVFINYDNNDFLRDQNFTAFAVVTKGMDIADKFKSVGDPGSGLNQNMLWMNGEAYLRSLSAPNKPTMIESAQVIEGDEK